MDARRLLLAFVLPSLALFALRGAPSALANEAPQRGMSHAVW